VNQNRTFAEESGGGYLWSPQRNRNGARNQFYENMRRVAPGDIVFSFVDTLIKAIGIVRSSGYSAPQPAEFGNKGKDWANSGWRVDVEYHPMPIKVRPKSFIDDLRPHLPPKYSPLDEAGDGLQSVYLAEVPEQMARVLTQRLRAAGNELPPAIEATSDDDPEAVATAAAEDRLQEQLLSDATLTATEKMQLVLARRGQGRFRRSIVDRHCRVTGISSEKYLVASHIKPWRDCDNAERLDGENGLLLAPHVDFLFDKGFITFSDDGAVIVSPRADPAALQAMGIDGTSRPAPPLRDKQRTYLRYHRANVFKDRVSRE
jgi:hypothetical protein